MKMIANLEVGLVPGCDSGFWQCADQTCVPERFRCDGIPQCEDGSDEVGCVGKWMCLVDFIQFSNINDVHLFILAFSEKSL